MEMSIQKMQQKLIDRITTITDQNILEMLDDELSHLLDDKIDLSKILSKVDFNELLELANEPHDANTISLKEFNDKVNKWRTRS